MGVWIETDTVIKFRTSILSLPMWECGLKHLILQKRQIYVMSLPIWERGLSKFEIGRAHV